MNFFLRENLKILTNGVLYLGYLSQQFLEGLPDTQQPNVVEEVGYKPGIQQVEDGWRTGKGKQEGKRGRKRGRKRRRRRRRGGRKRKVEGGGKRRKGRRSRMRRRKREGEREGMGEGGGRERDEEEEE